MEKDEIIQLLKSNDIEDRKLGVILLSKVCTRKKFRDIILKNEAVSLNKEQLTIFHSADWEIRVYVGIQGLIYGVNQNHDLKQSVHEYGTTNVERYELDI